MALSISTVRVARVPIPVKVMVVAGPYPFPNGAATALGDGRAFGPLSMAVILTGLAEPSPLGPRASISVLEVAVI